MKTFGRMYGIIHIREGICTEMLVTTKKKNFPFLISSIRDVLTWIRPSIRDEVPA